MPIIHVEMLKGRSVEQKRQLAEAITKAMVEIVGARSEGTMVVFHELKKENLARGGHLYLSHEEEKEAAEEAK